MSTTPWAALVRRQAATDSQRENSGRLAFTLAEAVSTGFGDFLLPDQVTFDVDYIEMPHLMHAPVVDGDTLVENRFPRVTCGVYRWNVNSRGLYVGAWVYITVDTMSSQYLVGGPDPGYLITHQLTFAGQALKWAPADELARRG